MTNHNLSHHIARLCILTFLLVPAFVLAESVRAISTSEEVIATHRLTSDVITINSAVPGVHEFTLPNDLVKTPTAVYNLTTDEFVYHNVFTEETLLNERSAITSSLTSASRLSALHDLESETTVDFKLPPSGVGEVELYYETNEPFTSSAYFYRLAPNVARPQSIAVYAENNFGVEETILAPRDRLASLVSRVPFPETTSNSWRVVLTYTQPLRLEEAALVLDDPEFLVEASLRFLGTPGHEYQVFADPDRSVFLNETERINLEAEENIVVVDEPVNLFVNPSYTPADSDSDGVIDELDNCVDYANPEQVDVNGNGRGDLCDDFDGDGRLNHSDNCVNEPNRSQRDEDGDSIGDACDEEESRLTEKHAWIPWVGMGIAAVTLIAMFMIIARRQPEPAPEEAEGETESAGE